ncbi:hypothetical protein Mgra_00003325 [Meloidogyne graminicola]|uniref:Uncharacterized protein n=2 Tax=Meloidogyne graminicola TaxID=189291 RepID=A0A8S9ZUF2_9BILA|nr:hypothetical protein Mgra_00003325 [Meloidogyne graminicola]
MYKIAIFYNLNVPLKEIFSCAIQITFFIMAISRIFIFATIYVMLTSSLVISNCSPVTRQEMIPSLLPVGTLHESLNDPFLQQQRWLSVRPFKEYPRPHNEELGLLLQYLDSKRNAPILDENVAQLVGESPLGTMRFGKRRNSPPLGTMRFG